MYMQYGNQYYEMTVGEKGNIISFKNKGKEMLADVGLTASEALLTVCLIDKKGTQTRYSSSNAECEAEYKETEAVWRFHMADDSLIVKASARFPKDDPMTYWSLSVKNDTGLSIEWIDFPGILIPNNLKGKGGENVLFWPGVEGGLIEDLSLREKYKGTKYREIGHKTLNAWCAVYPGVVSMQFMACYSEKDGKGIYTNAMDMQGNVKQIDMHPLENSIRMEYRLFPGTTDTYYEMAYEMQVGVFDGDWYDAADLYRNWLESNWKDAPKDENEIGKELSGIPKPLKITENPDLPEWYGDSPVILIYPVRGNQDTGDMTPNSMFPYIEGAKYVDDLAEKLGCRVMALLMHWEGTAPWAPPRVWPPFGGEAAFKEYADHLHAKGNLLGVYCSGIGWTNHSYLNPDYDEISAKEYETLNIEQIACRTSHGTIENSLIIGPPIRDGIDICSHNELIRDIVSEEVGHIVDSGCDYAQYFDQNLGGAACLCYSDEHGHAPVPGKWMTEDMVRLYKRLITEIRGKGSKMLLGCEEGAAENFISYLTFSDSRYGSQYYYGKPVPAYGYLFHEYLNNMAGNQDGTYWALNTLDNPTNLAFRIANCFIAGNMMSLILTHDGRISWGWGHRLEEEGVPDQEEIVTLTRNLNNWRRGFGKPYLFTGRMQKPVDITGLDTYKLLRRDDTIVEYPGVLYTCWKAADGSEAQIFVNFRKEKLSFQLNYAKACTLIADADGEEQNRLQPGDTVEVPGLSAVMVKF